MRFRVEIAGADVLIGVKGKIVINDKQENDDYAECQLFDTKQLLYATLLTLTIFYGLSGPVPELIKAQTEQCGQSFTCINPRP